MLACMVTGHSPTQSGPVASGAVGGGSHLRTHRPEDQVPAVPDMDSKGGGGFLNEQSLSYECKLGGAADNVDDPLDWRQQRRHTLLG